MKTITDYFIFAWENGYRVPWVEDWIHHFELPEYIYMFTSKEFIEAIARGIEQKLKNSDKTNYENDIYINNRAYDWWDFESYGWEQTMLPFDICHWQAEAIMNWKLEEFINQLLQEEWINT